MDALGKFNKRNRSFISATDQPIRKRQPIGVAGGTAAAVKTTSPSIRWIFAPAGFSSGREGKAPACTGSPL
jgi:hypothetical protein